MLDVRVDDQHRTKAANTLAGVGLKRSGTVRILLTRVVAEGGLSTDLPIDPETHDEWFYAKAREALNDMRSALPCERVTGDMQALADGKRRVRT